MAASQIGFLLFRTRSLSLILSIGAWCLAHSYIQDLDILHRASSLYQRHLNHPLALYLKYFNVLAVNLSVICLVQVQAV